MKDPVWCEDCNSFGHADIGGEGWCDAYNKSTWYGCNAAECPNFTAKPKEGDQDAG
jgi:hypothetical protein